MTGKVFLFLRRAPPDLKEGDTLDRIFLHRRSDDRPLSGNPNE
jgi:hypothetical protein